MWMCRSRWEMQSWAMVGNESWHRGGLPQESQVHKDIENKRTGLTRNRFSIGRTEVVFSLMRMAVGRD